jgi:predicted amidophosphoribosyltransferase
MMMKKRKLAKCPKCGTMIDIEDEYCWSCGFDFVEDHFKFSNDSGRSESDRISDGFDLMNFDGSD